MQPPALPLHVQVEGGMLQTSPPPPPYMYRS